MPIRLVLILAPPATIDRGGRISARLAEVFIATVDPATCAAAMKVCACFNLRRASRAVTRLFDEVLGRGGLRSTQFVALAAIRASGTPSLPKLSRALGVDRSTLTRSLQPLIKLGFVEIGTKPPAKTTNARLTPKGEGALTRCVPLWQEAQGRFESKVGSAQWSALLGGIGEVSNSAREA